METPPMATTSISMVEKGLNMISSPSTIVSTASARESSQQL